MDAARLSTQLLGSPATKALVGLRLANDYLDQGFTALRDLGSADPEWPTVDRRPRRSWRGRLTTSNLPDTGRGPGHAGPIATAEP